MTYSGVSVTVTDADIIKSRSFPVIMLQEIGMCVLLIASEMYILVPSPCLPAWHAIGLHLGLSLVYYALILRAVFLALRLKVNHLLLLHHADRNASSGQVTTAQEPGRSLSFVERSLLRHKLVLFIAVLSVGLGMIVFAAKSDGVCLYPGGYFDTLPTLTALTVSFFVFGITALWLLRTLEDTHNIRKDLMVAITVGLVTTTMGGVWAYMGLDFITPEMPRYFNSATLVPWWISIVNTTAVVLPCARAWAVVRRKRQALHGSGAEDANDMLFAKMLNRNDNVGIDIWQELKVFAVKDFAIESTLFLEELDRLQEDTIKKILLARKAADERTACGFRRESARRASNHGSGLGLTSPSLSATGSGITRAKCPPPWQKYMVESESLTPVPKETVEKWKRIHDNYVRSGAPNELNLSFAVAENVRVMVAEGTFTIGMFDQCREETIKLLFENTFQRTSSEFMNARESDLTVKKHILASQAVAEPTVSAAMPFS
ncbi:hypothetical protein M427DRAFT_49121 [Gonapodya prolifera JEL478]|uniref:RGS domain-containing protein n=1 Tax=Gonapodya prolifera (strain JEL478) TaxID=1344416 RepID=A0A139A056_GONPJ|nr:hypothetical protein M427DRAFT_49121 [Gonapodya prolifera JEL478]|eukprot:KXS09743.1 hypothetical protein M427DRAFT_49121 [Gonapodya prolifera JEL478]